MRVLRFKLYGEIPLDPVDAIKNARRIADLSYQFDDFQILVRDNLGGTMDYEAREVSARGKPEPESVVTLPADSEPEPVDDGLTIPASMRRSATD